MRSWPWIVDLIVSDPVIVAALGNGNNIVEVGDTVHRSGASTATEHAHGIVPVPERGHDHGGVHEHAHHGDHARPR